MLLGIIALRPRNARAIALASRPLPTPGMIPETRINIPETRIDVPETRIDVRPPLAAGRQPSPLPQLGLDRAVDRQVFSVMQFQLKHLGYRISVIDGIVGPETWRAMTSYTQERRLPVNNGVPPQVYSSGAMRLAGRASKEIIDAIDASYGLAVAA